MWISLSQVLNIMLCLLLCPILICVLLIYLLNLPLVLLMCEMMTLLGVVLVSLHHSHLIHGVNRLHLFCNLSDHLPFYFQLRLDLSPLVSGTNTVSFQCAAGYIDWHSISPEDVHRYCQSVQCSLPLIPPELLSCTEVSCNAHIDAIKFCCAECLHSNAASCFPLRCANTKRGPEHVRPFHERASFWNRVCWLSHFRCALSNMETCKISLQICYQKSKA